MENETNTNTTEEKEERTMEDMMNNIDLDELETAKGSEDVVEPDANSLTADADSAEDTAKADEAEAPSEAEDTDENETDSERIQDEVVMPTSGDIADNTKVKEAEVKADQNMPDSDTDEGTQNRSKQRQSRDIPEVGIFDTLLNDANDEKSPEQLEMERWNEILRIYRNGRSFVHSTLDRVHRSETSGMLRFTTHYNGFLIEINEAEFFNEDFRYVGAYYNDTLTERDQASINAQYQNRLKDEGDDVSDEVKRAVLKDVVEKFLERRRSNIKENMCQYMTGAVITFAITHASRRRRTAKEIEESGDNTPYEYTITGSRVEGMKRARDYYFNPNSRNCVHENDTAVANILYTNARYVLAECCGVETAITAYELSEKPVEDPRDEFMPGNSLKVRIRQITEDPKTGKIRMSVSRRLYELNKHSIEIRSLKPGDIVRGTVKTGLTKNNNYSVILTDGIGCLINKNQVNYDIPLVPNDIVIIKITAVDLEGGFVRGRAERIGHVRKVR